MEAQWQKGGKYQSAALFEQCLIQMQVYEGPNLWGIQLLGATNNLNCLPRHAAALEAVLCSGHHSDPHAAAPVPLWLPPEHFAAADFTQVLRFFCGFHDPAGDNCTDLAPQLATSAYSDHPSRSLKLFHEAKPTSHGMTAGQ